MTILVVGKQGQLARCLAQRLPDAVFLSREDLDLCDLDVAQRVVQMQPEFIINSAAFTAVDQAEESVHEAWQINAHGPAALANAAAIIGVPLLHISTDYVFDGKLDRPYREEDLAAPLNVYGASKLGGEREVSHRAGEHWWILRTSWVYSEHGSNFLNTMIRLAGERPSLSVVNDQTGQPTYAGDLADVVVAILRRWQLRTPLSSGLYHFAAAGETTWYEFAQALLSEAKAVGIIERLPAVMPITTDEFPTKAVRPKNSRLATGRLEQALNQTFPHWKQGMQMAIANINVPDAAGRG